MTEATTTEGALTGSDAPSDPANLPSKPLPEPYADCDNCGNALIGPYCWHCGQPTRNLVRFFPALIAETLEGLFDVDSRLHRTLVPLMFRPGKLTVDYIEGRRARYVPPLRLYLFTSIIFFLVLALTTEVNVNDEPLTVGERGELIEDLDRMSAELEAAAAEGPSTSPKLEAERERQREALALARRSLEANEFTEVDELPDGKEKGADKDKDFVISFGSGEEWDPSTDPVNVSWFPDWLNEALTREAVELEAKIDRIEENPQLIVDEFFGVLPQIMFVLVPLFALILKLLYVFKKRYYMEHLILALYSHSFIFLSMLIMLIVTELEEWISSMWTSASDPIFVIGLGIVIALWVWIPVYLLIAQKRMYRQGWLMTIIKYLCTGVLYLSLLLFGTVTAAVLGMVMMS